MNAGNTATNRPHQGEISTAGRYTSAGRVRVGVGIATGKAFVGNSQSIDRLIWSAIGDTSNFAARIQALTRELNAAVVIDSTTRMNAGSIADDFERHESVPIRGRRRSEHLYALPLSGGGFLHLPTRPDEGACIPLSWFGTTSSRQFAFEH